VGRSFTGPAPKRSTCFFVTAEELADPAEEGLKALRGNFRVAVAFETPVS